MKKNDELSSVELQRILLACCNISLYASHKFSMERVIAFSMERVIAFSTERVLVGNVLQLQRNFGVPQGSISRSICVPVTRSLLGYFCPVLYLSIQDKNTFSPITPNIADNILVDSRRMLRLFIVSIKNQYTNFGYTWQL